MLSSVYLMACRFVTMHDPIVPSGLRHNSMPTSGMRARGRLLVRTMPQTHQKNAKRNSSFASSCYSIFQLTLVNVCGFRPLMQCQYSSHEALRQSVPHAGTEHPAGTPSETSQYEVAHERLREDWPGCLRFLISYIQ